MTLKGWPLGCPFVISFEFPMICVPVFGKSIHEICSRARKAADFCDLLELRLDLIGGLNKGLLKEIIKAMPLPVIATNRALWEGGSFEGSEEERIGLLEEAVASGAIFVDIEFATKGNLKRRIKRVAQDHGARLIYSHHDFEKTPPFRQLRGLFEEMVSQGADVVKIVTFATDRHDFLELSSLYPLARRLGVDLVAFCMGEKGCFSRLFCLDLGAFLTFSAIEEGASSAPGQIPVREMKDILSRIGSACSSPANK